LWGIESDVVGQALVRSMIELARGLGIRTVAKGIEHSAVRRMLTELGVDLVQGFDIGRPGEQPVAAAR
jgi:EAL domain-containing protein (putative c-di-GMP-specific phosphodiesterase class I)